MRAGTLSTSRRRSSGGGGVTYPSWVMPGVGYGDLGSNYASKTNKQKWTGVILSRGQGTALENQNNPSVTANGANVIPGLYNTMTTCNSSGATNSLTKTQCEAAAPTTDIHGVVHYGTCCDSYPPTWAGGTGVTLGGVALFPNEWLLDPANTNVQTLLKNKFLADFQALPHLKMPWFDNGEGDYRVFTQAGGGTVFNCPIYPNFATWQEAWRDMARVVVENLQRNGYYVGLNDEFSVRGRINDPRPSTFAWWDYLKYDAAGSWRPGQQIFDANYIEYFMTKASTGGVRLTADDWAHYRELHQNTNGRTSQIGRKTDFIANVWSEPNGGYAINSALGTRYCRATFLLDADYQSGYSFWSVYPSTVDPWTANSPHGYGNINDGDIGVPTATALEINTSGAASPGSGWWYRQFSNGYVIVNPSGTSFPCTNPAVTVPAGDSVIHVGP